MTDCRDRRVDETDWPTIFFGAMDRLSKLKLSEVRCRYALHLTRAPGRGRNAVVLFASFAVHFGRQSKVMLGSLVRQVELIESKPPSILCPSIHSSVAVWPKVDACQCSS